MPRTKKEKPFEIDFTFPRRVRDLLFDENGNEKYTVAQLLAFAGNSTTTYNKEFAESVSSYFTKNGMITSSQKWTLENMAANFCPDYDELNKKFFEWYDKRPDMQQMYKSCATNSWWLYDRGGQHFAKEDSAAKGWHDRPDSWRMFEGVACGWEGSRYRELNRDVVYDVGDQVMLRKPFVNSYRYDPCYGKGMGDTDRIGMVVEHKEEITRRSRGGKGSRLINVLWISTGETIGVPERVIKKYREKKQE